MEALQLHTQHTYRGLPAQEPFNMVDFLEIADDDFLCAQPDNAEGTDDTDVSGQLDRSEADEAYKLCIRSITIRDVL